MFQVPRTVYESGQGGHRPAQDADREEADFSCAGQGEPLRETDLPLGPTQGRCKEGGAVA